MMDRVKPTFTPPDGYYPDQSNKNASFCTAPWVHAYVLPTGERNLCCLAKKISSESRPELLPLKEYWNSKKIKEVRRKMMSGEVVEECATCNNTDMALSPMRDKYNFIFRDKINKIFDETSNNGETTLGPISFDYRVSNLCNLRCKMCGTDYSSAWVEHQKRFDIIDSDSLWVDDEFQNKLHDFQLNTLENELRESASKGNIKELYWAGGEPSLYDIHWEIMKYLVDTNKAKDLISVRYNTNLTSTHNNGISLFRDLLPHFKNVEVNCSIDGVSKHVEFIRTGLIWNKWLRNFEEGYRINKDILKLDMTITLPSLFCMKEFFDFTLDYDVEILAKHTLSYKPQVMSPLILPNDILVEIVDDILEYIQPKASPRHDLLISLLKDLKTKESLRDRSGEERYFKSIRGHKQILQSFEQPNQLTMEKILSANDRALKWWKSV